MNLEDYMKKYFDLSIFDDKKHYKILMFIPFYGAIISMGILFLGKKYRGFSYPGIRKFFVSALFMVLFILPILLLFGIITNLYEEHMTLFFYLFIIFSWIPADIAFMNIYKKTNLDT
jgi:hypothetical protein